MDYDGDGHNDILSGCFPGHLYLFHRQADGSFAEKEQILDADGKPIKQGSASTVFATDWDDDQDLDLIVGDIEGFVWLIKNQGTRHQPAYGNAQKLTAPHKAGEADSDDDADKDQDETDDDQPHENEPIQVAGGDSGPVVADWDQDGLMDLVVGAGDGSILLYRNAGTKIEPKLAAVEVLVPASRPMKSWADAEERREEGGPADGPVRGIRAKVCVTDWNGDRRPDLLVGDFIRRALPPRKLSDDERAKKKEADQAFAEVLERYQEAIAKFTESLQAQQSEADAETESTDDAEDEKNDDTDATDEVEFEIDFDQFAKENPQLMEEFQRAAEERQKYEEEGRTEMGGHVWVYLGVDGP